MNDKSPDAFRTISEVATWLDVPTHVLRFWESRFTQIKPVKRAGNRRYYRPADMELLGGIKKLLHDDGLTIRGVQKLLREEGVRHVASLSPLSEGGPGPRGALDHEAPMQTDVPTQPPLGQVVPFAPEAHRPPDPDAALHRWPFFDDTPIPPEPPSSLLDLLRAAPRDGLCARAGALRPLVARMVALHDRLAGRG